MKDEISLALSGHLSRAIVPTYLPSVCVKISIVLVIYWTGYPISGCCCPSHLGNQTTKNKPAAKQVSKSDRIPARTENQEPLSIIETLTEFLCNGHQSTT